MALLLLRGIVVKKLGLLDSGNSTKLGLIISSKLARQLHPRVDKSKAPKVGLAYEGQQLMILGQSPDLELGTRLDNGKLSS